MSNGHRARYGSITSRWEHFYEWKRLGEDDRAGSVEAERLLNGMLAHDRLLDLVENFILFYAMGELLSLNIAVEENTRLTAALLLKMHQDSQVDTRSTYTAGFANEPAPYK